MIISIRVKKGWKKRENKQEDFCDICGAKLWIAPHGHIYCNEVHNI